MRSWRSVWQTDRIDVQRQRRLCEQQLPRRILLLVVNVFGSWCPPCNAEAPDLAILDINLPDMLGDEVAEKIRETSTDMNIIMITGYSSFKDEVKEDELGIKEVLMKPIPPEDLVKITKRTLLAKDQS